MNVNVNKKEKSKVELEFTLGKEEFAERLEVVFKKNAKHFKVPGYRPGKAPRNVIENMYGKDTLNYSVIEEFVDEDFTKAMSENTFEMVGKPALDVKSISREEGAVYTVTFDVKPEAVVTKYKGLEVKVKAKKVTKKDVDAEIETVRNKNARTVTVDNRELKEGDVSNINFEGFKDSVAFEGGKADNFDLVIGSKQFIPGFEDQMIGMKIGETKDINVTFPENYQVAELAGAPVVFKVTLNSISEKILPELNDEFAKDVSEFETLKEYTAKVKEDLTKKVEAENKASKEIAVFDELVNNMEVEIPDSMIEEQAENLAKQTEQELSYQGMSLDTYCQYLGIDKEVMKANFKAQALKDVKLKLALEAVAKQEEVTVTDEEIEAKIDELVKAYGKESENNFKNNENIKQYLTEQLKQEKLINLIVETSVVK